MLYKPTIGDQLSGSIGGVTASRNKSGGYFRRRGLPVNPGTPEQEFVRQTMTDLSFTWREVLTQEQRDGWDGYAVNSPLPNKIGDVHSVNGLAMYVRGNLGRLQAGLARVDNAPSGAGFPSFTVPTLPLASQEDQELTVGFTATNPWAGVVGAAMLVYASRGQTASKNFFKGPYRYAGAILGAASPPTSPAAIPLPFPVSVGQRLFVKVNVVDASGRASDPWRGNVIVAS